MNDIFKHLLQIWNGVPANRRIPIIVTVLAIVAGLTFIIVSTNKPKMAVLFGGMQPAEAAKVVDFLQEKKVRYEIGGNGQAIYVPEAQVLTLRLGLASAGVPRASDTAGGVGFEILDKPSFGMSDLAQKINYTRALQGELARTIKQMEDIESARVMIVPYEERLFSKDQKKARASVFLQIKSGRSVSPEAIATIRFFVANSVEGLEPNHVVVADSAGHSLATDDSSGGGGFGGGMGNAQLSTQQAYEKHLKDSVQEMLDQVLGPGQANVKIAVDMDFDVVQQTTEHFDPKSVVGSEQTTTETSHSNTQTAEATAGAHTGTENNAASDKTGTESNTSKATAQNQYNVGKSLETIQKGTGVVSRITVAVIVNEPKSATGTAQPRTTQEKKALEESIKAAIGYTDSAEGNGGKGRHDLVTVQESKFAVMVDPLANEPAPSMIETAKNRWMPYVSQAFLVILAGAVLLYLRTILQSSSNFETEASGEFSSLLNRYKKMADDALAEIDKEKKAPATLSPEEIGKLIRYNPQNTANAIKAWMSRN